MRVTQRRGKRLITHSLGNIFVWEEFDRKSKKVIGTARIKRQNWTKQRQLCHGLYEVI